MSLQFVALICDEDYINPVGDTYSAYSIMPRAICTDESSYIVAVRDLWRKHKWIAIYDTDDDFKTTKLIARVAQDAENPPALVQCENGDIWLFYITRESGPKCVTVIVSKNGEYNWSVPVYFRTDGLNWDCGYPIAITLPDGQIGVGYYWQTP